MIARRLLLLNLALAAALPCCMRLAARTCRLVRFSLAALAPRLPPRSRKSGWKPIRSGVSMS